MLANMKSKKIKPNQGKKEQKSVCNPAMAKLSLAS